MNGLLSGILEVRTIQVPDMTDFGRRSLIDEEFNASYQEELQKFCERIFK